MKNDPIVVVPLFDRPITEKKKIKNADLI